MVVAATSLNNGTTHNFRKAHSSESNDTNRSTTTAEQLLQRTSPTDASNDDNANGNTQATVIAKPGDSLSRIAARYPGVSAADLAAKNNISNPDLIYVGQRINIPVAYSSAGGPAPAASPVSQTARPEVTVKSGDTLTDIAARYPGVTVNDIATANNISNPNLIFIGQKLTIPDASVTPTNSSGNTGQTSGTTTQGAVTVDDATVDAAVAALPSATRNANPNVAEDVRRILEVAAEENLTPQQTAYVLATATHESGMGAYMEEFASGAAYEGRADLGNTQPGDGVRFKGRGYVQITGRANYQDWSNRLGVDLVANPELAEDPAIAARILVTGMKEGTFTGRGLDSYINDSQTDYVNARRTVNGTDRSNLIAGYARNFDTALSQSAEASTPTTPDPITQDSNTSVPRIGAEGGNAPIWAKSTANTANLAPTITRILDDVVQAWAANDGPTPVITSGNDGRHSNGSLHYSNQAIDLRANNISDAKSQAIADYLQSSLGSDYDVIFEHFPGNTSNDHIHIEYDPN